MPRSRRVAVSVLTAAVAASAWVASTARADTVPLPTHTFTEQAAQTAGDMSAGGITVLAWWNFDTKAMYAATRVPGDEWQVQQIGAASTSSSDVDVVENGKGVFTVVWQGPSGLRTRQWSASGGWKAIKQISSGTDITNPDADAAPNGNVTVLWRKGQTGLRTRTRTSSGWQPVKSLSTARLATSASLVTDGEGRQTVVWSELRRDPAPGEDSDDVPRVPRMAKRGTPTAGWGSPTWLEAASFDAGQPRMTVGGDDVVTIAYNGRNTADASARRITARRFTPGGGSLSHDIEQSNSLTGWVDVTADEDGDVFLVYTREGVDGLGDLRSSHFLLSTGDWSNPTSRVTTGDVVKPEVEWRDDPIGFNQQLAVMWSDYDDSFRAKYALASGTGAWSAPAVLGTGALTGQSSRGWLFDDETNILGYVVAGQKVDTVPFDRAGPTTKVTGPAGGFTLATSAFFTWSAVDRWSPIEYYDTFVTRRTPFLPGTTAGGGLSATPLTAQNLALPDHSTTCLQARAKDTAQPGPGGLSTPRCLTTPVDNTLIDWPTGWSQVDQAGAYMGTVQRSKQQGKSVTMNDVHLRTWALLVTKAPGNGTVEVFFDGVKKATRSLAATTTRKKVVVPLPAFAAERQGDVRVRIKTADKWVQIDGIFLGR